MMDLQKFRRQSRSQRKETKKLFRRLRAQKPVHLDHLFRHYHEEAFNRIDCLECANCCKTTGPLFTEKDIDRLSKHLGIKTSDFIDKYLRVDEDNDFVLQSTPCPFLGEDNYCSVYEVRPKACADYPHTNRNRMHQILELTRKNVEVCPAVHQIVNNIDKELKS